MSKSQRKFKAEVQQVLDIVVHSLYSNRDIFLRELVSNASDALDRARFESLSNKDIVGDDPEWKIRIEVDKEARTLTVSDNGIGMTRDEVADSIGTIANSGTRRFIEEMKNQQKSAIELIGQFGVGFYSAFMVADKVTVLTRHAAAAPEAGVRWQSEGGETYTIEDASKPGRGTAVTLHLKEDASEYLEEWKIRKIVKEYSDFVEHPVCMDVERSETPRDEEGKPIEGEEPRTVVTEETLNSRVAVWAKPKDAVTDEEYKEFYHHISHDFGAPWETIHWNVEGTTEFRALLFIPERPGFGFFDPDPHKRGIHLYIKRVYITDNCDFLVPSYLRFVKGVVDSSDLPLNVSREMLQENRVTQVIGKNLVKKVLDTLGDIKEKNRERYEGFWKQFGGVLKEGIHLDFPNRDKLAALTLFETAETEAGALVSLDEYVSAMPESQKDIYYVIGDNRTALENSPHLEAARKHGYNVLFLTDAIDDWVVQSLSTYKDKSLRDIARGDVEFDSEEEKKEKEEERRKAAEEFAGLVERFNSVLGEKVKDVRLSSRLTDSACCLVVDEHAMGVHMEKLMKAMHGDDMPAAKRILELNADHQLLGVLQKLHARDAASDVVGEYAELLYDQAALTAGVPIDDPLRFAQRVSRLMGSQAESLLGDTPAQ